MEKSVVEEMKGAVNIDLMNKGRQFKTAYEIAKAGGKHAVMYRNSIQLPDKQLEKALKSLGKSIEKHKNLIKDPARYLKGLCCK